MLQSSWMDPVLGLDVHIVAVPAPPAPAPIPTPLPLPFVGMVFDPAGAIIGAAISTALAGNPGLVTVNNFLVTNCGTNVTNLLTMPHPPVPAPGVAYVVGMPGNNAELYFGSLSTSLQGTYGVRLGDVALSCSDPVRLPTSFVVAIPKGMPVLNMNPMVPDLAAIAMAIGMRLGMRVLRALLRAVGRVGAALFRGLRRFQHGNRAWSRFARVSASGTSGIASWCSTPTALSEKLAIIWKMT